jgi:hypothetical protein
VIALRPPGPRGPALCHLPSHRRLHRPRKADTRPGELFFFKTHAPHNRVVGGGFFGGAVRLPASEAWDLLGPANGAVSLEQMVDRIVHYRREPWLPVRIR